ncbi:ATP-binding protein [Sunxiuqinia sp. sy24]|uniref:ATP-binding protein n=1 Tax=Sunxiuqinia sp. sy24 TaxID=3461495 RepID=UPI004045DDBC
MNTKQRLTSREPFEKVLKSKVEISRIEYISDILSSMSSIVCILNDKNQIVFLNDTLLERYNIDLEEQVLGVRPGEMFNCVNAKNSTGGCGTTEKCEYCGAKRAFDRAWEEKEKVIHECKITSQKEEEVFQLDLEVTATPIQFDKEYLIVSINDITEQKRKVLLERIFFHDIMNIAGSLSGVLELLPVLEQKEKEEYLGIAGSLTEQIIDEIKGQQQMIKAESGELIPNYQMIEIEALLKKLADQIRCHNVSLERGIDLINQARLDKIYSDQTLLIRVLINMVKNAMEAIPKGDRIVLKAKDTDDYLRFSVHNDTFIPHDIQMQIFQRSYSTKGDNRGVGTYSMKLLGEKYLEGSVGFTSTEKEGTTFFIDLPTNKLATVS